MYDLIDFRATHYSQFGEDGILEKIFSVIPPVNRWCVELGAWDGAHLSNTCRLIEQGWRAVLIEEDPARFASLKARWASRQDVVTLNERVRIEAHAFDDVLARTPLPEEFDLLSLDIDGDEYYVWDALSRYRPRVVVVESNFSFPFNVEFVQKPGKQLGSSALSLNYLGRAKGYALVGYNVINCFFVRRDLAERLELRNRSFAYLFHLGREHHIGAVTSYTGRLYVMGDAVYGMRRLLRPKRLERLAQRFAIVRGTAYRALFSDEAQGGPGTDVPTTPVP